MYGKNKVLVVGTTSDYVHWIRNSKPERALFLTERSVRKSAKEPAPDSVEEILFNLKDLNEARLVLSRHIHQEGLCLEGITSFDCEAMPLAASLAKEMGLSYASPEAVALCQDKFHSKRIWMELGISSPVAGLMESEEEVVSFFRKTGKPCVLKPKNGTGSEFIFICRTETECRENFQKIIHGLNLKKNHPMYAGLFSSRAMVTAEVFMEGEEFSCDFILEEAGLEVVRICRKWISHDPFVGTAMGYVLLGADQADVDMGALSQTLEAGARSLGLTRALCMADFILVAGKPVLLEMAPRAGGDCIPFLLKKARGLDILGLSMDFAAGKPVKWTTGAETFAGLRLHADRKGVLKKMDIEEAKKDPRVLEIHLTKSPGHVVQMPPEDYDSRHLGHILFKPDKNVDMVLQFRDLRSKIGVHFA
ncbi:MAG: ATP-grasp domain-containing protein [Proteobacteria bacterium]|nr:ATP-grasp domain-containing protein [Pseudomonadota bacterium]MBU4469904.1 ATP-grasp domain-containing protein [Pseudomonadota bacterium]MCG2751590.1 ATP-grasp domain-containing protein [Desulfobacteraceae bacterium]